MAAYVLTSRARQDILDIWRHIAEDSEQYADQFVDRLVNGFRLLGDNPYLGRRRDELRVELRCFPIGNFLILYRVAKPGVQILHVVHGQRNLNLILD